MSESVETAACIHCRHSIRHVRHGDAGGIWEHIASGKVVCRPVQHAAPDEATILPKRAVTKPTEYEETES